MAYQIHRPDAKQQFISLTRAQTALGRPDPAPPGISYVEPVAWLRARQTPTRP